MINKSNLLKHREIYLSILLKEGVLRLQRYEEISIRTSFLKGTIYMFTYAAIASQQG